VQPTAADALMAMVYRQTGNYPETLLEEINGDLPKPTYGQHRFEYLNVRSG
jgi:hypothetical protein